MGPYEGAPVEWIHNGKRIFPEMDPKKYEIISDGLTKVLVIKDLKENEQGKFGVKIGETLCSANLQVKALQDVTEQIGGSVKFDYNLPYEGAPVEWVHNGKKIYPERNPEKYQIISKGLVKTLVIKDVKEEEKGTIGVKIGDKVNTAKLEVKA